MCYIPKLEKAKQEYENYIEQHPSTRADLENMMVEQVSARMNTLVGAAEWGEVVTPKSAASMSHSQSDEVGLQLNDLAKLDQQNPAYVKPPTPLVGEAEMAHSNDGYGELQAHQQL